MFCLRESKGPMRDASGDKFWPQAEENAIFGVGISLRPGSLDVAALFPVGCSAEQSGSVAVGDEVVSVDGHDSLSGDRARRLMKGRCIPAFLYIKSCVLWGTTQAEDGCGAPGGIGAADKYVAWVNLSCAGQGGDLCHDWVQEVPGGQCAAVQGRTLIPSLRLLRFCLCGQHLHVWSLNARNGPRQEAKV